MSILNPDFSVTLKKFGAFDTSMCYNCGNCTAICSLSDTDNSFPRNMIRASVLGLEDKIQRSLDPWNCYYCGECSSTCPREANPGELMMSLRRYLTAAYDWTGLSKKFYTSKIWELVAIVLLATVVLVLFLLYHGPMETTLTEQGGVKLNTFAPWKTIEIGDWIMAGFLSFFLLSNVFNMYRKVILKDKSVKVPLKLYFTELWKLIFHFATQWQFKKCSTEEENPDNKKKSVTYWIMHWLLMSGYVTLFVLIVGFLEWFQTDEIHNWWHPQRLLGYYATFGLTAGIIYFTAIRLKKNNEKSKFSHYTDWTFLILLFLTTISGILVHIFRINGMPNPTYYMYVFHLMVLFPMLMIEVPFSKWSHLAYRPFSIYFNSLKNAAKK
ncbi:MAG: 4Fe-4S dicluster domain-containing protein [Bacteroidales bacterium]|nr:4Fe-4S dicluster domain-containing protein [Bacteroidales bacterium]